MASNPTEILTAAVDEYIAALPEPEVRALIARTREPGTEPQRAERPATQTKPRAPAKPTPTEYPAGWDR